MKQKLLFSLLFVFALTLTGFAQTALPSAETVMQEAYKKAGSEHKNVLVIFHASWCGWCKKMEASINEPTLNKMFTDNYVIVYLDVLEQPAKKNLENPGAQELMTKYKGDKSGLPFWFITDAGGNKLADSQIRPAGASLDSYGESVGCPAADTEVAFFKKVLKSTSTLKEDELSLIGKRFAQNKPTPSAKPAAPGKNTTSQQ